MNLSQIVAYMSVVGLPSLFTICIYFIRLVKKQTSQIKTVMIAVQAQMRDQLLKDFKEYDKRGWASDIEVREWVNRYNAYHQLGANGVLDNKYNKILELPNEEPVKEA